MTVHSGTHLRSLLVLGGFALLAFAVVGCGGDDDDPTASPTSAAETASASPGSEETPEPTETESVEYPEECEVSEEQLGLITKLDTGVSSRFETGQAVEATLRIINCGDVSSTLYYPTSERSVLVVSNDARDELWRSDDGQAFDQVAGEEIIAPGDILSHSETWNQTDRDGAQLPPGLYSLFFSSLGCGQQGVTEPCRFGDGTLVEIVAPTETPAPVTDTPAPS